MKALKILFPFILLDVLLIYWCQHNILFWDTVQFAGRHGLWYLENGFSSFFLPERYDSGHPPFFGLYIASMLQLFGRSIETAHWAMLPILICNTILGYRIGKKFLRDRAWVFLLAISICPFYLGHSVLVSPDLILISGFLFCLLGLLEFNTDRKWSALATNLFVGSVLLGLISMRGFLILSMMVLWALFHNRNKKAIIALSPGIVLFCIFQIGHYLHTDWVGFHGDSPWASSFNIADLTAFAKNSALFGWRLADYMMFIPWVITLYWIVKRKALDHIDWLIILIGGILFIVTVPFSGLVNHRYYLPLQILVLLQATRYLHQSPVLFNIVFIILVGMGNFIIYPNKIAQGWDSTAAHWPIYNLEKKMYNFIENNHDIDLSQVSTTFPLRGPRKHLDFSDSDIGYNSDNPVDAKYVLFSNILNDLSDKQINRITSWHCIHHMEKRGIKLSLYKNPHYS